MPSTGLQMHIHASPSPPHQCEHSYKTERVIQETFAVVIKENPLLSILEKSGRKTEDLYEALNGKNLEERVSFEWRKRNDRKKKRK